MSNNRYNKHQEEEHENLERWLITYSDLITLLLIFFIVMYTMAKIDAGKYNALKQSLAGAFANGSEFINVGTTGILDEYAPPSGTGGNGTGSEQVKIDSLEEKLQELVKKYNLQDYIKVFQEERGLDIEIRNELTNIVLFESGSAELNPEAVEIISKIGLLLRDLPNNYVRVEGHTDNVPIHNERFNSNWELSASRAINVVKLLINRSGLDPTKLSAVGYGEYKPVADNNTIEGRAKNRRVNIVIIRSKYSNVVK